MFFHNITKKDLVLRSFSFFTGFLNSPLFFAVNNDSIVDRKLPA